MVRRHLITTGSIALLQAAALLGIWPYGGLLRNNAGKTLSEFSDTLARDAMGARERGKSCDAMSLRP